MSQYQLKFQSLVHYPSHFALDLYEYNPTHQKGALWPFALHLSSFLMLQYLQLALGKLYLHAASSHVLRLQSHYLFMFAFP